MFKLLSLHLCNNTDFSFNVYRVFGHILLNTVTIRVVFIILQVVFLAVNKIASNATDNLKLSKRISALLLLYFPDETSKSCQQWAKIISTFKLSNAKLFPNYYIVRVVLQMLVVSSWFRTTPSSPSLNIHEW